MKERISEAMEAAGLTPAELARATKSTASAITQWLDGTTKSLRAEKSALLELATGYRAQWIVFGTGPKLVSAEPPSDKSTMQPILAWEHPDDLPAGEYVMIPRLDVHLSAGNGHEQVEISFVERQPQAFRADWIRGERLKPAKLACMTARGDSMEPSIWDGDSLVVDISQTDVIDGRVYAMWYEGGERVKRLYRLPGGGLRIKSDNPEFAPIELTGPQLEHVRVIGRVVHRSGRGGL